VNPRQVALVGWGMLALLVCVSWPKTRSALFHLMKTAMTRQLAVPALGSILWNGVVVYALLRVGFWDPASMWWDTAVFILFGTTALVSRLMKDETRTWRLYGKVALTGLGLTVLIGTLASTYTFGPVIEVILLPWVLLLGALIAVADASPEQERLAKVLRSLATLTGLVILGRATVGAVADSAHFLTLNTGATFLLPLALTTAFLPYLFVLHVSSTYETACVSLNLGCGNRPVSVSRYAVWRMVRRFGLNLSRLERFRTGAGVDLRWAATRQAVDEVFDRHA
jgi:hypothetical protein